MTSTQATSPCYLCGGSSFSWGWLHGYGQIITAFKPYEAGYLEKMFGGGEKAHARRCNGCGNILLFADSILKKEE